MIGTWQPIDSAPKWKPLLVVANSVVQYAVVQLCDNGKWMCLATEEEWYDFSPTHWMPLPVPPSNKGSSVSPPAAGGG